MAEEILIDTPSGEKISALAGKPVDPAAQQPGERTLVIMVHGFPGEKNSHNDIFGGLERVLTESGFHTLRFDFRGCGASDGRSEHFTLDTACDDLHVILKWAKKQGYKRLAYVAEGLGVSAALLNLPANLAFMILLWPVLDPKMLFEQSLADDKDAAMQGISLALIDSLQKADTSGGLLKLNVPLLILHGAQDKQVPIAQLDLLRQHFRGPRAEITTFEDGEHGLLATAHRQMVFHHTRLFAGRYGRQPASKIAEKA